MDEPVELPMFPLGSVLFPAMPLPLRVFEARYLTMLDAILAGETPEFGVVLIERGQEVGGGEQRFGIGTVARIAEVTSGEGMVSVLGSGHRRFEIVQWLAETPFPRAMVRFLPDLEWDESCEQRSEQTELLVRRTLQRARLLDDQVWPSTVELEDEPITHVWQLAGIAPLGPLDQIGLLGAHSVRDLLDAIFVAVTDVAESLDLRSL
ncbi:LON peptidase substrate-binding domain-containing protein [Aeromicrobium sp.]|uniref:LON peptidase substrate-binding domain-containing protein n=1 Tax=Aeromicrobium sp. TaxID=1871063 RepID=UPI003C5C7536